MLRRKGEYVAYVYMFDLRLFSAFDIEDKDMLRIFLCLLVGFVFCLLAWILSLCLDFISMS